MRKDISNSMSFVSPNLLTLCALSGLVRKPNKNNNEISSASKDNAKSTSSQTSNK
jgi:hypothetical protein